MNAIHIFNALIATLGTFAFASFRVAYPIAKFDKIDPIKAHGKPETAHEHIFASSARITPTTTGNILRNGNCSASSVASDNSAYWAPSLYYRFKNGSEVRLETSSAVMYYLFNTTLNQTIHPLPVDLRLVAGNASATGPDNSNQTSFRMFKVNSTNPRGDYESFSQFPGSVENIQTITAVVRFPSCLGSLNILDGFKNASNFGYPIGSMCPPNLPYAIPAIRMFIMYTLPVATSWSSLSECPLRYSTSETMGNGYQYHGAMMSAWDQDVIKSMINKCGTTHPGECVHNHVNPTEVREKCLETAK